MDNTIIRLFGTSLFFVLLGCGGNDDGPMEPIGIPPTAAILSAPAKDEVCLNGKSINDTQSEVEFKWEVSSNTDSYNLVVKNLITDRTSTYTTTAQTQNVTLNKGEPYSWHIISKADNVNETTQSAIWKFYLAGDGMVSYAPFPAEIVFPEMGSSILSTNGTLTLAWKGSDADNDIDGYELLFDAVDPPQTSVGTTSDEVFSVAVAPDGIYYWQIITKDDLGNTSTSEVFQFKTE